MIRSELAKQFRRLRTWLGLAVLAALPVIVAIANTAEDDPGEGAESALYAVSTASGLNHALAALTFMSVFFLVVVVSMFAGDSVASESNWGTIRYLLVRPVTRTRLLAVKFGVVVLLTLTAVATIVVAALVSGTIAFGWGPISIPFLARIPTGEGLARLTLASLYVTAGTLYIVGFAGLLSTLASSSGGPVTAGVTLGVVSQILDGIGSLDFLHPALPTHYASAWSALFLPGAAAPDMVKGLIVQAAWLATCGGLAWWWFRRRDVLA